MTTMFYDIAQLLVGLLIVGGGAAYMWFNSEAQVRRAVIRERRERRRAYISKVMAERRKPKLRRHSRQFVGANSVYVSTLQTACFR